MNIVRLAGWVLLLTPTWVGARYLEVLPSEIEARRALQNAPQIVAAREQANIAAAHNDQLRAGEHEWTVGFSGQRRTDALGPTYTEETYELSRGVRAWGKAGLDRDLGKQVQAVGEYAYSDSWHEAARALLAGWFEWLRADNRLRLLQEQATVLSEQLSSVESRVRAGDAPRIEQALAGTESNRQAALIAAAQLQEREAALQLQRSFPDIVLNSPRRLDVPEELEGSDESWVQRILDDNHEIALADGQKEEARLAAQRVGRDRIPDPTVGLRYSNNFDGNKRVIGLVVSVPLGGPRRSAAYAAALGEASVAVQRARNIRLKVESDARRATLAMRSTYLQWQQLEDVATQSRANAQAVKKGYSLGEFTISELLAARKQALDAELGAASARLDALEAAARLQMDAHKIWIADSEPSPVGSR